MTTQQTGRIRTQVEGLRWAHLESFIRELTHLYNDLTLTECYTQKGLLRCVTYFTVEGGVDSLESWKRVFTKSIANYNR